MPKKTSLETQIREALIDQEIDELFRITSDHSEYKKTMMEISETMMDYVINLTNSISKDREIDEEEMDEMRKMYQKEVLPQIQAKLENPEQLREMISEQTRNQYMSVKQLKAKMQPLFAGMREEAGIEEALVARCEKAFENLFYCARINDKIVRKLVKVAQTESLEKALQKETRYTIIRELFPTPNDYKAFIQKGIEKGINFCQQVENTLMSDGEVGQVLGKGFGAIKIMIEKQQELVQKNYSVYLEQRIREIYKN